MPGKMTHAMGQHDPCHVKNNGFSHAMGKTMVFPMPWVIGMKNRAFEKKKWKQRIYPNLIGKTSRFCFLILRCQPSDSLS